MSEQTPTGDKKPPPIDKFISEGTVAGLLGISIHDLRKRCFRTDFPRPFSLKGGRNSKKVWRQSTVEKWIGEAQAAAKTAREVAKAEQHRNRPSPPQAQPILTRKEVLHVLGINSMYLSALIEDSQFPRHRRWGNNCYWHRADVIRWMDAFEKNEGGPGRASWARHGLPREPGLSLEDLSGTTPQPGHSVKGGAA